MKRLRDALLLVLLFYPLIVCAIVVVIRDNEHVIATYNVELVRITNGTVTGLPDRIFASGF